jgi:hypothetical protein
LIPLHFVREIRLQAHGPSHTRPARTRRNRGADVVAACQQPTRRLRCSKRSGDGSRPAKAGPPASFARRGDLALTRVTESGRFARPSLVCNGGQPPNFVLPTPSVFLAWEVDNRNGSSVASSMDIERNSHWPSRTRADAGEPATDAEMRQRPTLPIPHEDEQNQASRRNVGILGQATPDRLAPESRDNTHRAVL